MVAWTDGLSGGDSSTDELCCGPRLVVTQSKPYRLDDGLLVTQGGETRALTATWNILVVLDALPREPGILENIRRFQQFVHHRSTEPGIPNATCAIWISRIARLQETTTDVVERPANRPRRGLINFVGDIGNKLFGFATEEQVNVYRRHLEEIARQQNQIVHTANELITVVKQNQKQIQEDRKHVKHMEDYITKMARELGYVTRIIDKYSQFLKATDSAIRIDRALVSLEAAHNIWLRQRDRYQRQRASLELGRLTEDVLPPTELRKICDAIRRLGHVPLPLHWYYEHTRILPIWEEEERLVFKAQLAITDSTVYHRYFMDSWPVPDKDKGLSVQLQVPRDVAIDTSTGGLFAPMDCQGRGPAICHTGPVYDRSQGKCPRGILSGIKELHDECRIEVKPMVNETRIDHLADNMYMILTQEKSYFLHCIGEKEHEVELTVGLHVISLEPGCRATGDGWVLIALAQHASNLTLHQPIVEVPPLGLQDVARKIPTIEPLHGPTWVKFHPITDVTINQLRELQWTVDSNWVPWTEHISWTTLVIMVGSVILLGWVVVILHRRGLLRPLQRKVQALTKKQQEPSPEDANPDTKPGPAQLPLGYVSLSPWPTDEEEQETTQ